MAKDITHAELMNVLTYQPETGEFAWNPSVPNFARYKKEVGYINRKGQRFINIHRRNYAAHRLAWFYVKQEWPTGVIIPKDGDYLNLCIDNLQEVSMSEFSQTFRQARHNPSSGMTGVSWDAGRAKWVGYITINYKRRHLGYFDTKEDAAKAYAVANEARAVGTNLPPEKIAAVREAGRRDARLRSLWRRVQRQADGQTGWADFPAFAKDIGTELHDRQEIRPINTKRPVGPGNWKWELSLFYQFDTTTPEGRNAYSKATRNRNPLRHRAREFLKKFGLTLEDYYLLHDAQDGLCACCGRPESVKRNDNLKWLAVDHCHSTGAVRGLLCNNCNNGIGRFRDDPKLLRTAADYLERHAMKNSAGNAFPQPREKERECQPQISPRG